MDLKRKAGEAAVGHILDGMVLGLGTGSTVRHTLEAVARLVGEGWDLSGVPTSRATEALAKSLGIPLTTLEEHTSLDLALDGADEVDPRLNLIKGLGGALLREKIVAAASDSLIVIVEEGKLVNRLGEKAPLPVEVLPFGLGRTQREVEALGCEAILRMEGDAPYVTDNGNWILHCRFPRIDSPAELGHRLKSISGVLEHGLFLEMADLVIVGRKGGVEELRRP